MDLSRSECDQIAKRAFNRDDVVVLDYGRDATGGAWGFNSSSNSQWIKVKIDGKTEILTFFVKILPTTGAYHLKVVRRTKTFEKESAFFDSIYPLIRKYLKRKVFPECFLSHSTLTVLENLSSAGYVNHDSGLLDVDHIKVTLEAMASLAAASFLYENEAKTPFNQSHQDVLFVSWFNSEIDHPGYMFLQTSVKAIRAVLDRYFAHESKAVRNQALSLLSMMPSLFVPSKNHRNVITHNDLWSNNIMFKYDTNGKVDNALLIDLQLFGYNPPAHDVFTLLFLNAVDPKLKEQLPDLVRFYYDCFTDEISSFGFDANQFLSFEDFERSKEESVPVGLCSAVLHSHCTFLPAEIFTEVMKRDETFAEFFEKDRVEVIFKCIEQFPFYKQRLFASISNLLEYLKGKLKV